MSEIAVVPTIAFGPEISEKHTIYSLLLMSVVKSWWNGNKMGGSGQKRRLDLQQA